MHKLNSGYQWYKIGCRRIVGHGRNINHEIGSVVGMHALESKSKLLGRQLGDVLLSTRMIMMQGSYRIINVVFFTRFVKSRSATATPLFSRETFLIVQYLQGL